MGNFQVNSIISKNNSIISGSLSISGSIDGLYSISASYVTTSSYVVNAETASYTTIDSIPTSSYSIFAISSSISNTASIAQGPVYAPTQGIGYVSPNFYMGTANAIVTATTVNYPGVLYSPFIATRTYTATTMSIVGTSAAGTIISRGAIYSNQGASTSLPQYLLSQVSASVPVNSSTLQVIHMPLVTPITLQANNVYWIAFAPPSNYRFAYGSATAFMTTANPLLGPLYSLITNGTFNFTNLISSGSALGATFVTTASQAIADYRLSPAQQLPIILPVLKVTY
jgi:hypothetical protein